MRGVPTRLTLTHALTTKQRHSVNSSRTKEMVVVVVVVVVGMGAAADVRYILFVHDGTQSIQG